MQQLNHVRNAGGSPSHFDRLVLGMIVGLGLVAFAATAAHAGTKVEICHIPPGNPVNFHTITVSDKALPAHLAHGDVAGSCFANAELLCDDGDACTIDAMDPETETCLADHPPVNCDDSLLCTTDTCDPVNGCQYAPIVCDDGDACTVDACNPANGQCTETPIDCGPLGICLADTGQCDYPCDGITCDPIDQCHTAGECVLPGECVDGAPVADGTPCDDGNADTENDQCTDGVCAGETPAPTCPCFGGADYLLALEKCEPLPEQYAIRCYIPTGPNGVTAVHCQDDRGNVAYNLSVYHGPGDPPKCAQVDTNDLDPFVAIDPITDEQATACGDTLQDWMMLGICEFGP